jgi:hypothetical protein
LDFDASGIALRHVCHHGRPPPGNPQVGSLARVCHDAGELRRKMHTLLVARPCGVLDSLGTLEALFRDSGRKTGEEAQF